MAVTIYKALNYSDQIVEATIHMLQKHEKLLTSALYVKNVYKKHVFENLNSMSNRLVLRVTSK